MRKQALIIAAVTVVVAALVFAVAKIEWPVSHDHVAVVDLASPVPLEEVRGIFAKIDGVSGVAGDRNGRTVYVGFISDRISADGITRTCRTSGLTCGEPRFLTAQEFRRKSGGYFHPNCTGCRERCGR